MTETASTDVTPDAPTVPLNAGVAPSAVGLGLVAYRLEDEGYWSFGVHMGGAYIELATKKLGFVDDDLREAAMPGQRHQRYLDSITNGLIKP
jgi:hypothetical protein